MLAKCVCVIPKACAVLFMTLTKASSLPAMCSAIATHASLPEVMMMPFTSVSTGTSSPSLMNNFEPPVFQAFLLIWTLSSRFSWLVLRYCEMTYMVIILVRLAGLTCLLLSFSLSVMPLWASISMCAVAFRCGAGGVLGSSAGCGASCSG